MVVQGKPKTFRSLKAFKDKSMKSSRGFLQKLRLCCSHPDPGKAFDWQHSEQKRR